MITNLKLKAELRNKDLNPRQLRAEGFLPATIYGKGTESISIQLPEKDFYLMYRDNQGSNFMIDVDGKNFEVSVQDVQKNYSTNQLLNVEFKIV